MSLVEPYLYDGEAVLYSLCRKSILSEEEIAATDSRIVCAKGRNTFYDVRYDGLASIGIYSIYPVKLGILAIILAFIALIVLAGTTFIPTSVPLNVLGASIDLTGIIGLLSFLGTAFLVMALLAVIVFVATIKQGIIMKAGGSTHVFKVGRGQGKEAVELTKIIRSAGLR